MRLGMRQLRQGVTVLSPDPALPRVLMAMYAQAALVTGARSGAAATYRRPPRHTHTVLVPRAKSCRTRRGPALS